MDKGSPSWLLEVVEKPCRWKASSCLKYRLTRPTTALGACFAPSGSCRSSFTKEISGRDVSAGQNPCQEQFDVSSRAHATSREIAGCDQVSSPRIDLHGWGRIPRTRRSPSTSLKLTL